MYLAISFLLLFPPLQPSATPTRSISAHARPAAESEVVELVVPKACVQHVECKDGWHLKKHRWSCQHLSITFTCYQPRTVARFAAEPGQ